MISRVLSRQEILSRCAAYIEGTEQYRGPQRLEAGRVGAYRPLGTMYKLVVMALYHWRLAQAAGPSQRALWEELLERDVRCMCVLLEAMEEYGAAAGPGLASRPEALEAASALPLSEGGPAITLTPLDPPEGISQRPGVTRRLQVLLLVLAGVWGSSIVLLGASLLLGAGR